MAALHDFINTISLVLNVIGSLIIIAGVIISLIDLVRKEVIARQETVAANESIRIKLGSYLVLGLEFFIAGDIIRTIVTPTWEGVGILGAIVVIRTILSYFLTKDLRKL
jgi:uncharacterized membrane protein